MTFALEIIANNKPEVLERIFRTIRHRGFNVTKVSAHLLSRSELQVNVDLYGEREIHLITQQLEKLYDVNHCQLTQDLAKAANN
ncbi:acetolactate synthase 2 small subunit [Paraferrimonas sp. SM1919]|uniref:acetolactate synthase 2 small subunit n=1 Tax=Paraferrimonas sp. SM1919 TaxID=2662263 RepID=UPI0013D51AAD|nr:acetolactate synthase 2 small subunit [Paraferrimonas sp. SM1919]